MKNVQTMIGAAMVCALVAMPFAGYAQDGQPGIVFVDMESVFTNYYKTKDAEAQLKEQAEEIKAERQKLVGELEKLQGQYGALRTQAQSPALKDEVRAVRRAEAEDKLLEVKDAESRVRRLEESAQRRMDEQSRRARTRLVEEISVIIREHATARGYAAIIDSSGNTLNGLPSVVFYNPKFDITAEIISLINSRKR
jgi:outer membrane protein